MKFQIQFQNKNWPEDCWETFAETTYQTHSKMVANYLLSLGHYRVRIDTMEIEIIEGKPFKKPIKFKGAESPK